MQLSLPNCQRLPAAAGSKQRTVLRSPLAVVPRGGLTSLRRDLVVPRVGSDPGVPSQGPRYNTTPGGGSGSGAGGSSGSGGRGGSGGSGSGGMWVPGLMWLPSSILARP